MAPMTRVAGPSHFDVQPAIRSAIRSRGHLRRVRNGLAAVGVPDRGQPRDDVWWYGWHREFGFRLKMIWDVVSW